MIPKILHYIWLSNDPYPETIQMCLDSWKKNAPEYQIKHWSMKDFDFSIMPDFVNEAISVKKWACAADYLRLWILEKEGGFYLDSDVFIAKAPDDYLCHRFVTSFEYYEDIYEQEKKYINEDGTISVPYITGLNIQAAIVGSEPHHPLLTKIMTFYHNHHFILPDGSYFNVEIAPHIYAAEAVAFGMKYRHEYQELAEGIVIYPCDIFPNVFERSKRSIMFHMCVGSWRDTTKKGKRLWNRTMNRVYEAILLSHTKWNEYLRFKIIHFPYYFVMTLGHAILTPLRKNKKLRVKIANFLQKIRK